MSLQNIFRVKSYVVFSIMALLAQTISGKSHLANADEIEQKSADSIDENVYGAVEHESSEIIDEITVYGDKSISALRREIYKAEENFFDVFNSLNQDFEYDINCYYEAPTGTRIRRHVCKANFVVEATSVQYVELRTSGPRYPTLPPELVIAKKKKILRQKMEALVAEHPELLQALTEYTNKRAALESEREKL